MDVGREKKKNPKRKKLEWGRKPHFRLKEKSPFCTAPVLPPLSMEERLLVEDLGEEHGLATHGPHTSS